MNAPTSSLALPSPPRGFSFELSDLIIILGWSEFHDLRMVVELDDYIGGEEDQEVLVFYPSDAGSAAGRCGAQMKILWCKPLWGARCMSHRWPERSIR